MHTTTKTILLTRAQRVTLRTIQRKGTHHARELTRARVLTKSAAGMLQKRIAEDEDINRSTVQDICMRFHEGGLARALYDAPRSGQPPKLDEKAEAHLIALACSEAPEGYDHWTLELLRTQMITDKKISEISTVALWQRMKDHDIKPWREKNVVHAEAHRRVH